MPPPVDPRIGVSSSQDEGWWITGAAAIREDLVLLPAAVLGIDTVGRPSSC